MDNFPIDAFPTLTQRLGKAKTARIRYHQKGRPPRVANGHSIENPVWDAVQDLPPNHPVEDVLYGFAQTNDGDHALGVSSLLMILQVLPVINSREISIMFDISERQARKYYQLIKAALPHVEKALQPRSPTHGQKSEAA